MRALCLFVPKRPNALSMKVRTTAVPQPIAESARTNSAPPMLSTPLRNRSSWARRSAPARQWLPPPVLPELARLVRPPLLEESGVPVELLLEQLVLPAQGGDLRLQPALPVGGLVLRR